MDFGRAFQESFAVYIVEVVYRILLGASVVMVADVRLFAVRLESDVLAPFDIFQFHNVFLVSGSGPSLNHVRITPQGAQEVKCFV